MYLFIHAQNGKIETRARRFVCKIDPRYKSKMADILMPCTIRGVALYGLTSCMFSSLLVCLVLIRWSSLLCLTKVNIATVPLEQLVVQPHDYE